MIGAKVSKSMDVFKEDLLSKNIAQVLDLFSGETVLDVEVRGWVRSARAQKERAFLHLFDGSSFSGVQVVIDFCRYPQLKEVMETEIATGAAVFIRGDLVSSPAKGQRCEIQAKELCCLGACPSDYPLQKKRHSFEFLRTIPHLRSRSNTVGAVTRLRHHLASAIHQTLSDWNFIQVHTPVLTTLDCEGAGEMFTVGQGKKEEKDFFGQNSTHLTVSGQLHAEAYALSHKRVYTFGPTFRAENSHTSRHLAEFWMLEPEMAFFDLDATVSMAGQFLKRVVQHALDHCREDLEFFDQFVSKGLLAKLEAFATSQAQRMSYSEAIKALEKADVTFEYPVSWGLDLQSEHERWLCEKYVGAPVAITDYPKQIKAFYMRANDDEKTVAAMDFLVPGVGEIIGGSQREERLGHLEEAMIRHQICEMPWYLDLRRFGGVPHSGFGLGFERLVQWLSGVENIRETIAFPRSAGSALL